jgi:hypothetical protein
VSEHALAHIQGSACRNKILMQIGPFCERALKKLTAQQNKAHETQIFHTLLLFSDAGEQKIMMINPER